MLRFVPFAAAAALVTASAATAATVAPVATVTMTVAAETNEKRGLAGEDDSDSQYYASSSDRMINEKSISLRTVEDRDNDGLTSPCWIDIIRQERTFTAPSGAEVSVVVATGVRLNAKARIAPGPFSQGERARTQCQVSFQSIEIE